MGVSGSKSTDSPNGEDVAEAYFVDFDGMDSYRMPTNDKLTLQLELGHDIAECYGSLKQFEVC